MQKRLMLHSGEAALSALGGVRREYSLRPRFEIAPGQMLGAVWNDENGARRFSSFHWGITPAFWDGEQHVGHQLFSARAETLAQKMAFADSLKFRRALVPIDGFWQWTRPCRGSDEKPRPFLFRSKDNAPLYLAAIWELDGEGQRRLAIISVESNRLTEPFSDRMPAILRPADAQLWLERGVVEPKPLLRALRTPAARELLVMPTAKAHGRAGLEAAPDARDALALVYGSDFRADKPKFPARRRMVMRDHEIGGHVFFKTRSFTRDDATRWHPIVDVECGHVFCDCPDFRYRHEHHEPDIWTPHWWCKHVRRAVENLKRHGELPVRSLPSESEELLAA